MLTKLQIVQAIRASHPQLTVKESTKKLEDMIKDQADIRYGTMYNKSDEELLKELKAKYGQKLHSMYAEVSKNQKEIEKLVHRNNELNSSIEGIKRMFKF